MNKSDKLFLPSDFLDRKGIEHGKILCWSKEHESFQLYVFSAIFETKSKLEEVWQSLNDEIAINFQSSLEKEIEAWNIYLIFLIKEIVPKELKYKIEQDKFSCRKLVFDNFTSNQWKEFSKDDIIPKFISDRLFDINLLKYSVQEVSTLSEILTKEHASLIGVIESNIERSNYGPLFDIFLKQYE